MNKYLPLIISILLFSFFQYEFYYEFKWLQPNNIEDAAGGNYYKIDGQNIPFVGYENVKERPSFWNLKETRKYVEVLYYYNQQKNLFYSVTLLFQSIYGYIFLSLFMLSGWFIKPRRIGMPLALGVYLILILFFTII